MFTVIARKIISLDILDVPVPTTITPPKEKPGPKFSKKRRCPVEEDNFDDDEDLNDTSSAKISRASIEPVNFDKPKFATSKVSQGDEKKNYSCNVCGLTLSSKSSLVRHVDNKHDFKRFTCNICSKVFTRERYLHLHLKRHSRELMPLEGSTFIQLPKLLSKKQACINVQNTDEYCFKWCIISALYSLEENSNRCSSYHVDDIKASKITLKNNISLNFEDLSFPLPINQIETFERNNSDLSVNVFGFDEDLESIVGPYYYTTGEKDTHINILQLRKADKFHYVWIKNISRLLKSQLTTHNCKLFLCNSCLLFCFTENKFRRHKLECKPNCRKYALRAGTKKK